MCLSVLCIQRMLHTKHEIVLSSSMELLVSIPIMKLRLDRWRRCKRQQLLPGGTAGDGETSVGDMLDKLECLSLDARSPP